VRKEENSGTGTGREWLVVVVMGGDADAGVLDSRMDRAGRGVIASRSFWFWCTGTVGAEDENDESSSWS
jgi:hypothetical protein